MAPVLETTRLRLEPYSLAAFHRLCQTYASKRSRFVGGPLPPLDVWRNMSAGIGGWTLIGLGTWQITLKATGAPVGEVAVSWPPDYPEAELGWLLFDGEEKQGYALEAATAAKHWALTTRRVDSLVSYIDRDNLASQRLAERLGGRPDNMAATPNGDPCRVYRYRLGG